MTNSNNVVLATALANAPKHTFTGLIIRKKGDTRGRGEEKKLYGDDLVHCTIITGFRYENLVKKSLAALEDLDVASLSCDKLDKDGNPVTVADFEAAKESLKALFQATLSRENEATTDAVYEPLLVEGSPVIGSRVYRCKGTSDCLCRECTGDPKAPLNGTIYLQGLLISETVLEPAVNGPIPEAKSKAEVLAKNVIRKSLPIRRYVSYALEPGSDFLLRICGEEITLTDEVRCLMAND